MREMWPLETKFKDTNNSEFYQKTASSLGEHLYPIAFGASAAIDDDHFLGVMQLGKSRIGLIVMVPTGGESSKKNADLNMDVI